MAAVDVEKIAEAVLYEGYLLFPYRRSAMKNQQRWTFGGVYPRQFSELTGGDDPWIMQTQCLVAGDAETELVIKVRWLHVVERKVAEIVSGTLHFVEELRTDDHVHRSWEEAMERETLLNVGHNGQPLRVGDLLEEKRTFAIEILAGSEAEPLFGSHGGENSAGNERVMGAFVREWRALQGVVELAAEPLGLQTDHPSTEARDAELYCLTVRIVNTTPWPEDRNETEAQSRSAAVRQTFISTHTILRVKDGEFVSLLEPPDSYQQAAASCENIKTWPVLVGEPGERNTLLSSPIILYDYPQISPESQGNYFDATEIDELLALSVMTLTEEEKQEMRESDIHAREILERTEMLSEEQLRKMHGVVRYLQPVRREAE